MNEPYQWTDDDDEIALDAIIVGIGSDAPAFERAGMQFGEVLASVYWPDWIAQGDKVSASLEGPYTVPDALERAEHLRSQWLFQRVVIAIQDRSLWQEEWGTLAEFPGIAIDESVN